jgi:periplasmic protein TonB
MRTGTIRRFVILSLCLHGMLLAAWRSHTPEVPASPGSLTVDLMNVNLQRDDWPPPAPPSSPISAAHTPVTVARPRNVNRAATARPHSVARNPSSYAAIDSPAAATQPAPTNRSLHDVQNATPSATATNVTAIIAADSERAGTAAWLQTRLLSAFANYFDYPLLARRHGWEGQVKLTLRIEPDGHISHLQLAQSSGYAGLDEAALASARRIERLNDVAPRLRGNYLDMVLPIEYRLLGG